MAGVMVESSSVSRGFEERSWRSRISQPPPRRINRTRLHRARRGNRASNGSGRGRQPPARRTSRERPRKHNRVNLRNPPSSVGFVKASATINCLSLYRIGHPGLRTSLSRGGRPRPRIRESRHPSRRVSGIDEQRGSVRLRTSVCVYQPNRNAPEAKDHLMQRWTPPTNKISLAHPPRGPSKALNAKHPRYSSRP